MAPLIRVELALAAFAFGAQALALDQPEGSGRSWRMVTILPLSAVATPNWLPAASSWTSSLSEVSVSPAREG